MENKKNYSVAIDGPSGAGKSTLARSAARELGILYVDTGAIYRTAALFVRSRGADPDSEAAVAALLPDLKISIGYGADGLQRMYLDGGDVSDAIRLPEVSMLASRVSSLPAVRAFLLEMQRSLAREQSVIMDGRDIGTVVLPGADVKIFLTASAEERTRRRFLELEKRGTPKAYDELLREIEERDYNDSHRAAAPLRQPEDGVTLDTTGLDFRQSLERLLEIIRGRMAL